MASNLRVLVSNLGDGNWDTGNSTTTNETLEFPRGSVADPKLRFGASIDFFGWGSKTNWLIQIANSGAGAGTVKVMGHRPSGVAEEVIAATSIAAGLSLTKGGVGGEEIYGPFTHFTFVSTGNSGTLNYYVTAWNYGDILDTGA